MTCAYKSKSNRIIYKASLLRTIISHLVLGSQSTFLGSLRSVVTGRNPLE